MGRNVQVVRSFVRQDEKLIGKDDKANQDTTDDGKAEEGFPWPRSPYNHSDKSPSLILRQTDYVDMGNCGGAGTFGKYCGPD